MVVGLASLAGAAGCSGALVGAGGTDGGASGDDAGSTMESGLEASADAESTVESGLEASADASSCTDLENTASALFYALADQYLACSSDNDCTRIHAAGAGECADVCGNVVTNEAGASALPVAATTDCQAFVAQGCSPPALGCLAYTMLTICMSGTCEGWKPSLSTTATTFVHGVCMPFEIQFVTDESQTALAPHDIAFPMTTVNGTLYSDPECTMPLTGGTVTLPAGANSVAFGFEPLDAGQWSVEGTGLWGTIGLGSQAQ
jgi:hypothetical protein